MINTHSCCNYAAEPKRLMCAKHMRKVTQAELKELNTLFSLKNKSQYLELARKVICRVQQFTNVNVIDIRTAPGA